MAGSGISFYRVHGDSFQIAADSKPNHLVHHIFYLPPLKNMDLLIAIPSSINKTQPALQPFKLSSNPHRGASFPLPPNFCLPEGI